MLGRPRLEKGTALFPVAISAGLILFALTSSILAQVQGVAVDGYRDPQYTAEYARYRFFNYGPNPNMASGELYSFVGINPIPDPVTHNYEPTLYVYYSQNPRNINDNSYGVKPNLKNWHVTWTQGKGHKFSDLVGSDHVEFIFYDSSGNVKLDFYSDYISTVPVSATYPTGYHSLGFSTGGDGAQILNRTPFTWAQLESRMMFESSLTWNLNQNFSRYGNLTLPCNGGVDLTQASPPLWWGDTGTFDAPTYFGYKVLDSCQAGQQWEFTYGIELSIPLYFFPDEPVIEVVARAHNSPSKVLTEDNPTEPAEASIGDFVWFDLDGDAQQDPSEPGIPNVRVLLYWDRDGDGVFADREVIATTRTDANGYYLFDGLSGGEFYHENLGVWFSTGEYQVVVDESTLPGGVSTALEGVQTFLMTPVTSTPTLPSLRTVTAASLEGITPGVQLLIGPGNAEVVEVLSVNPTAGTFTAVFTNTHIYGSSITQIIPAGTREVTPSSMAGIVEGNQIWVDGTNAEFVTILDTTATTFTALFANDHEVGSDVYSEGAFVLTTNNMPYVLSGSANYPGIPGAERSALGREEDCRTADFGYRPYGGLIGDYVWFDADHDGIQDSGEIGIPGVSVELIYADTGARVEGLPSGNPVVTNASGYYLFYGVDPGTYRVRVIGGVPAGYVPTILGFESKSTPTPPIPLEENGYNLYQDFGYWTDQVEMGSIGDTVYLDVDWDSFPLKPDPDHVGPYEPGTDLPFANVTLALYRDDGDGILDGGDTFLTSTSTNSAGEYHFTGLPIGPSGTSYIVVVTDTQGALKDFDKYYPTVWGGVTLYQDDPLTSWDEANREDVDFPYVGVGVIGDRVWNDLDHDGIQDAGEPGIAGVPLTLQFYYDPDGPAGTAYTLGWYDWGHTTSNPQGYYYFSGLRTTEADYTSAEYRVAVTTPSGWTASPTVQGTDRTADSNVSNATVYLGGLAGYGTVYPHADLTIDFGFYQQNVTYATIGDFIWEDLNEDGLQNDGLPADVGFANVTLDLRNAAGQTLQTTTTDANGAYHFYGLNTATVYTVVVTDVNRVLEGYVMTTDALLLTPGLSITQGGVARTLNGGENYLLADAGYMKRPTAVMLSAFQAYDFGGTTVVEWQTSAEHKTAGFRVWRAGPDGELEQVTTQMIGALRGSPVGGTYRVVDPDASLGQTCTYFLEEVLINGLTSRYGPFQVTVIPGEGEAPNGFARIPREISEEAKLRAAEHKALRDEQLKKKLKGASVKVPVIETGLYFVPAAAIAESLGITPENAAKGINAKQFALTNRGEEVAYLPADNGSGFYFLGQESGNNYARENIYWVQKGSGRAMASVVAPKGKATPVSPVFTDTLHFEQDVMAATNATSDPESDYWFWSYMDGGCNGCDTFVYSFRTPGSAGGDGAAILEVHLQGAVDMPADPELRVTAKLNDQVLGTEEWDGMAPHTLRFEFSQGLLQSVTNKLELKTTLPAGVDYSSIWVDSFDITYERLFQADGDKLRLSVPKAGQVTVSGFNTSSIAVFEVTDPVQPRFVEGLRVEAAGAGYQAVFTSQFDNASYLAVDWSQVPHLDGCRADVAVELTKLPGANYVIITSAELADAASTLADYRKGQGYTTQIVDVADIMDEFNQGLSSPYAIRAFLDSALKKWKTKPQFVVLMGDGTFDYKDYLGMGCNLVPTLMVPTKYGLFPSDNALADVDGDFVPDVAIGRLPVVTVAEVNTIVRKMADYEAAASGPWEKRAVFVADDNDPEAGNFPVDSDDISALVPDSYEMRKVYLPGKIATLRSKLISEVSLGCSVFNYVGHGSLFGLTYEGLLANNHVPSFRNGAKLPVFTAWTCFVGSFAFTGFDGLSQKLVQSPNGGAIAALSPTGMSDNDEAVVIGKEFFKLRFGGSTYSLGEATRQALGAAATRGVSGNLLYLYGIIGDPAVPLR